MFVFSLTEGLAICYHHGLGTPSVLAVIYQPTLLSAGPLPHPRTPVTILCSFLPRRLEAPQTHTC